MRDVKNLLLSNDASWSSRPVEVALAFHGHACPRHVHMTQCCASFCFPHRFFGYVAPYPQVALQVVLSSLHMELRVWTYLLLVLCFPGGLVRVCGSP